MTVLTDSALRLSLNNLLEGIQFIGYDWTYLYLNDTAARHGQRPAAELVGRTMMACFPGIEDTELFVTLQRVMRTRRVERMLNEFSHPSGNRGWFELLIEPVPEGICILSLDVTDRRAVELQLRQAQRLETLGRLTGGVAHDFNNVLTAILGYAELLRDTLRDDVSRQDLQEIEKAAHRATRLTRQLLSFSRKQPQSVPRIIDVDSHVRDIVAMLARLFSDVTVEVIPSPRDVRVRVDGGHLEQILMNLAVNARDAMPQGGRMRISTVPVTVGAEASAASPAARPGAYVRLRVEDTGAGMSSEVLARARDLFFTTKDEGHGTGIGLATVDELVRESGGFLTIDSRLGQGTAVDIFLPESIDAPEGAAEPAAATRDGAVTETLLVLEPDGTVRDLMVRTLENVGYTVLSTADAAEAVSIVSRDLSPVQLLVSEIMLPKQHGPGVAQEVLAYHPGVRVLYVSGFPDRRAMESGLTSARVGLLPKPFTPDQLLRAVRHVLDA